MLDFVMLAAGLAVTVYSATLLVNGASSIAKFFKIPDIIIGLTIVAIGTSMPELAISVISAAKGNTDIATGNILGSNIANILLILGVSAIIYPLSVLRNTQYKEIPLGILAIALLFIMGNDTFIDGGTANLITRADGIVLLCFFIIFLYYTFQIATKDDVPSGETITMPAWKSVSFMVVGIIGLYFGGKYFVEGAVNIARLLGMSDKVIGLTIVAVGTSLPEFATSVVAAYKKNSDIAVGNIIGSNIINVFLILGITAVIKPLPVNASTNIDIAVALGASFLLFLSTFAIGKRTIVRTEGIIFLITYAAYLVYLLTMG